MTIEDFMGMCVEPSICRVTVFDTDSGEDVFSGYYDDLPDDLLTATVYSFDVPDMPGEITLNISMDD